MFVMQLSFTCLSSYKRSHVCAVIYCVLIVRWFWECEELFFLKWLIVFFSYVHIIFAAQLATCVLYNL
jgi:hypothetical protein